MKLILITMMMLSLGLLTACGSSGGSGGNSGDPGPSTGDPNEDPKEDDPKEETSDLDSLPPAITKEASENQGLALTIPEYKDTNSYAFTGADGAEVEQLLENVVFKEQPDFESKKTYSFVMTVTNAEEQTKDINVTINIIDVLEEFDSLPSVITESVNENSRFALVIPEYKDTNSYVFSGVDGDKVKLWPERGEVIFNYAPDFETQASYNFIMTVTSATESVKEVDVTLDINDVSNAFIFEVLAGSEGQIYLHGNESGHQDKFDTYLFTVQRDEDVAETYSTASGDFSLLSVPIVPSSEIVTVAQRFTITPSNENGLPGFKINSFSEKLKVNIIQWGDNSWKTLEGMLTSLCGQDVPNDLFVHDQYDSPNLSRATNLSEAMLQCTFNENLGYWDVSKVKSMEATFLGIKGSVEISQWDVSSVTDMKSIFEQALSFNSDLSQWDVSSVVRMDEMFREAKGFNSDLSKWNTSSVNSMSRVFLFAEKFNSDLSGWDVSSVKNMRSMFDTALAFDRDISLWDTSSVENMNYMFYDTTSFDQDISGWNVDKVTTCTEFKFNALLSEANTPIFQNCSM